LDCPEWHPKTPKFLGKKHQNSNFKSQANTNAQTPMTETAFHQGKEFLVRKFVELV